MTISSVSASMCAALVCACCGGGMRGRRRGAAGCLAGPAAEGKGEPVALLAAPRGASLPRGRPPSSITHHSQLRAHRPPRDAASARARPARFPLFAAGRRRSRRPSMLLRAAAPLRRQRGGLLGLGLRACSSAPTGAGAAPLPGVGDGVRCDSEGAAPEAMTHLDAPIPSDPTSQYVLEVSDCATEPPPPPPFLPCGIPWRAPPRAPAASTLTASPPTCGPKTQRRPSSSWTCRRRCRPPSCNPTAP